MIQIKQYDTGVSISADLKSNGESINYSEVEQVIFIMGNNRILGFINDDKVDVYFNSEHTSGVGFYNCEFKVKYKDNLVETFPTADYIKVQILKSQEYETL